MTEENKKIVKMKLFCLVTVLLWAVNGHALSSSLFFKPQRETVCPDGKGSCPAGSTCCGLKEGGFACCPVPEATCCSDNKHCCPKNYRCDVDGEQCTHDDGSILSWTTKVPTTPAPPQLVEKSDGASVMKKAIVCPDKKSQCMDGQTCCKLASGSWACCPLPEAICCADHTHCCPKSYHCDEARQSCVKDPAIKGLLGAPTITRPWLDFVPSAEVSIVRCDAQLTCLDGQTCCKTAKGNYQCCPYPKAICCSDKKHCCPSGYKCQPSTGSCLKNEEGISGELATVPLVEINPGSGVLFGKSGDSCPDGSDCPDGQTCCQMASGQYGCCPLPKAVCCKDKVHCCPNGYKCNIAAGTCDMFWEQIPWSTKVPATPLPSPPAVIPTVSKNTCNSGAWCKSGSTCCESNGLRGCCQLENAVCCGDGIHCCPAGTTCDPANGMCRAIDSSLAFTWHSTARKVDGYGNLRAIEARVGINCPDGSSCPESNTCCELPSKQYGCCPYAEAMCCSDQLHCCPHGMTCDVTHSRCVQAGVSLPWNLYSRRPAKAPAVMERTLNLKLNKDTCPDLTSVCAENTTCCLMQSGAYGCCPHKNAVCCSDKLHCCPYGTTCDVAKQTCIPSDGFSNKNQKEEEATDNEKKENDGSSSEEVPFPAINPYRKFN